jgi:replicative DNA helicase
MSDFTSIERIGDIPDGPIENWLFKPMGLRTGIQQLDDVISGVQSEDYMVIGGLPSHGKSALVTSMSMHFDTQVPVVFFTLEMSKAEVRSRIIANLTGLNWHHILHAMRHGGITPAERKRIDDAIKQLHYRNIILDDEPYLTPSVLHEKLDYIITEFEKPGCIVIDYVQLMSGDASQGRQLEMTSISHDLRAISREFGMAVIAVAQLNRGPYLRPESGFRPRLSDLRESGSFEQDATKVLFVNWPYKWKDAAISRGMIEYEQLDPDEIEIIVAKNREGPTGVITCDFHPECTKFEDTRVEF